MAEKITLKEHSKVIQPLFDKVIEYSQSIDTVNSDVVFEAWCANKEKLYEYFNNQLIIEIPNYQAQISKEDKIKKYNVFIEEIRYGTYSELSYIDEFYQFLRKIEAEEFYENKMNTSYIYKDKIIPAGTKVIKAFKYFIEDENILRKLQDRASNFIQEATIEGTLCISIHPLDFLSSSENTFNWRSCHSLDGEYRAGNLSYIMDSTTFIVYIKSANGDTILPRFPNSVPWNNKKWRRLMFLASSGEMIFAGRPYPFECENILKDISNTLIKTHNRFRWLEATIWKKNRIEGFKLEREPGREEEMTRLELELNEQAFFDNRFIYKGNSIVPLKYLMRDECADGYHYNDLLYSSNYFPYHIIHRYASLEAQSFPIGSKCMCLRCGGVGITDSGLMLCCDCFDEKEGETWSCDGCGTSYGENVESYTLSFGDVVCSDCYHNHTKECPKCNNRTYISIFKYSKNFGEEICMQCRDAELAKETKINMEGFSI